MEKKIVSGKSGFFERVAIPVIIAVGIPAVIFVKFLEPSWASYRSYSAEIVQLSLKSELLKKQLSASTDGKPGKQKEKPVIYLLNYLEKLTGKSDIRVKSFQDTASGAVNGISAFQMRFVCNFITFERFLYMCENTFPPLAVSSWRISSLAGGSYSGMRQLEGTATVSFLTAGSGAKAVYADQNRFKAGWRDIFAEMQAEMKPPSPPAEETEPDPVLKWSLTAQMSDGDSDLVIITDSLNRRVTVDIMKAGGNSAVKEDNVEITLGAEKFVWKLGDAFEKEKLPAWLMKAMVDAKSASSVVPPASTAVQESVPAPSLSPVPDNPPVQPFRRSRRNRANAEE